jgi:hypothetical protein
MEAHQRRKAHLRSLEDLPGLEAYLWHHGSPPKENGSQSDRKSPPSRIEAHLWQFCQVWKPRSLESIKPGQRPDRAEAGLPSVAAVSREC